MMMGPTKKLGADGDIETGQGNPTSAPAEGAVPVLPADQRSVAGGKASARVVQKSPSLSSTGGLCLLTCWYLRSTLGIRHTQVVMICAPLLQKLVISCWYVAGSTPDHMAQHSISERGSTGAASG